jgi:hypothetical protein
MKRLSLLAGLGAVAAFAVGQTPDALVKLDLRMSFSGGLGRDTVFRTFDPHALPSTVGLNLTLEPGYQAVVTQRFQRIAGDADDEQLDESYVEDPGYWRAGKQYLPFGTGRIVVETATAAKVHIEVGGDQVPAELAVCQGQKKTAKGFVGRIGGKAGLSFAFGGNFGASATSLANLRLPEGSPGKGRGWSRVIGADYTTKRKLWTSSLEVVRFSKGATDGDEDETATDLVFTLSPSKARSMAFGWGRLWHAGDDVFRVEMQQLVATSLWLEPSIRIKDGRVLDLNLTIHVKL